MNARLCSIPFFLCTFLAAAPSARALQDAGTGGDAGTSRSAKAARIAVESELVVRYFSPAYASAGDLEDTIGSMFGNQLWVFPSKEGETFQGNAMLIRRIERLGDVLIVRDTAEQADQLLRTLADLDKAVKAQKREPQGPKIQTFEFTPKHIGLSSLRNALQVYERQILVQPSTPGGQQENVRNVSVVSDRGLVIVREEPERLAEIQALLGRLDVPSPEVVITCWLVRGTTSADAAAVLPEALSANLKKLVPMAGYQQVAVGVIRSAVSTGDGINLQAEVGVGLSYSLQLSPSAYDAASGELTLSKCVFQLTESDYVGTQISRQSRHNFQTQLSLRPGEYTVIGTVGGDPVFVVLRLSKA